jgi:hypothetical protein
MPSSAPEKRDAEDIPARDPPKKAKPLGALVHDIGVVARVSFQAKTTERGEKPRCLEL